MNTEADRAPEPTPEVYPGAPLKAVAIECTFAPLLDAVQRFGAFQRKHATTFTRTTLADARDARDANLLLDEANGRGVAISASAVSLVTYSYAGGFAAFEKWSAPLLAEALDLLEVARFTGIVYRYENLVDMDAGSRKLTVDDVLLVGVPRHGSVRASAPKHLILECTQPWPLGEVTVDIGSFSDPTAHLHIDISARRLGPLQRDEIAGAIREAHQMARLTFEELITPSFREHLRGRPS
jgi:uncharacterized protein (TIGR04255 family)